MQLLPLRMFSPPTHPRRETFQLENAVRIMLALEKVLHNFMFSHRTVTLVYEK